MKRVSVATLLAASACALTSGPAWALTPEACDAKGQAGGACFGTELTFTNVDILTNDHDSKKEYQKKYYTLWRDQLKSMCANTRSLNDAVSCRLEKVVKDQATSSKCVVGNRSRGDEDIEDKTAFRVCIYGDNALAWTQAWHYEVGVDGGCIELSSKPMNYRWLQAMSEKHIGGNLSILDKFLFNIAYSLHADGKPNDKLQARKERGGGGGHVHIDAESAFGNNPIKMLNFMTDIHNLRMFPLGPDMPTLALNCPPLSMLWPEQRVAYRRILTYYDQNKGTLRHEFASLKYLGMEKIEKEVHYATYIDRKLNANTQPDATILRERLVGLIVTLNYDVRQMAPEVMKGIQDKVGLMSLQEVQKELLDHPLGGNRSRDYVDAGDGWAHKAHDIRMDLDRYGTIELRNIAAEASTSELLGILGLLHDRAAMTEGTNVIPLLDDAHLKLSQPDDDMTKDRNIKYYATHDLTSVEAGDIAVKFIAYVEGANRNEAKSRLNVLKAFMPATIKGKVEELTNSMH